MVFGESPTEDRDLDHLFPLAPRLAVLICPDCCFADIMLAKSCSLERVLNWNTFRNSDVVLLSKSTNGPSRYSLLSKVDGV